MIARDFASQAAIQAKGKDSGEPLLADPDIFENLVTSEDAPDRSVLWQKAPRDGHRLLVRETTHSWRGEVYEVWVTDAGISRDEARAALGADKKPAGMRAVALSGTWQAPWVFKDRKSGTLWMIDAGQPYDFLADWHVHAMGPRGMREICALRFHPETRRAESLLPPAVRILERLLDQTMGLGHGDGTLNSTAGLRLAAQHAWANAAMRPWAEGKAYNTREEVDEGLRQWAGKGASYQRHHQAIHAQYPVAERALADFYRRRFARPAAEARALAAYWLDVSLRAHYTFHAEARGADGPAPNPWRGKIVPPSD